MDDSGVSVRAEPSMWLTNSTPSLRDPSEPFKGEDLEAARIGEHGPVPGGEAMQSAKRPHRLLPRAEVEVVGIPQNDLRAGSAHLLRMKAAYGSVGSDGHERRGQHRSMRQDQPPGPREAFGGIEGELEHGAQSYRVKGER